jgi:uncharacterized membrane protein
MLANSPFIQHSSSSIQHFPPMLANSLFILHSSFFIPHFPLAFTWPIKLQYFSGLVALALFAALGTVVVLLGMWSMAGMGPGRKWTAIGVRLAVLLLFILILGGIRWQKQVRDVEVMVLQDQSDSVYRTDDWPGKTDTGPAHRELDAAVNDYLRQLAVDPTKKSDDRIGLITFKDYVQVVAMPNKELRLDSRGTPPKGQGTNIAAAIQLALATMSPDAMHRFVLISDGNPNLGDTEAAINAAVAQHVPIDVMPLHYDVQNDVSVARFVAPSWKREGEAFNLSVVIQNTNPVPVTGKLRVSERYPDHDDDLELEPGTPHPKERTVTIPAGEKMNETVHVPPTYQGGVHRFHAVFTPDNPATGGVTTSIPGSTTKRSGGVNAIEDNDSMEAFTFVKGKGQVLYVDNTGSPGAPDNPGLLLARAMAGLANDPAHKGEGINLKTITIDQVPNNVVELQNYDAVILNNVPLGAVIDKDSAGVEHAIGLSSAQDAMLRTYVHDMGGGLVMIGGPDTFGAGSWGGSEVEKILPVDMDIPAQRQVGKGALVMVMHSCEMPQGNYWGEQCALKAVEALSARDEVGVISYGWNNNGQGIGGAQWDYPLASVGNRDRVTAAIKKMQLGDMPSFDDAMNLAINGVAGGPSLAKSDARHKHIIIISDGDPQAPVAAIMQQCKQFKISVSTVTVFPHGGGAGSNGRLPPVMDDIPKNAWPGGKAFGPIEDNPSQLPQIFIKQASIVKRSLIHEDENGMPLTVRDPADDMIKGIPNPPPVFGIVLTSRKNDPKVEMPLSTGKMNDPVLAHWQTGLGKSAVWTSDAHNKWARLWVGSPDYSKLWAQVIRGVSRPPMSGDFDVRVNVVGGKGEVIVEALDKDAGALNFLNFTGTVAGGTNLKDPPQELRLIQIGPGTYKATFDGRGEGAYVVALNYRGQKQSGFVMGGTVVNTSPEASDLKSNEVMLEHIRAATGGRMLDPFEPKDVDLFDRAGLIAGTAPLPVWDLLLPFLVALIIIDVAVRRIAWDWQSTKRMVIAAADRVLAFSAVRKVETRQSLDALRGVRDKVAETHYGVTSAPGGTPTTRPSGPPPLSRPDPSAKFVAKGGVEGDITQVVGGATDKPIPPAPKKIEPKGGSGAGGHIGGLMAAKKRAQQQIKEKEQGEQPPS